MASEEKRLLTNHFQGISWLKWNNVCQPKSIGDMGFRDLHLFNLSLLSKQGWRLLRNKSSLYHKVFKARYFLNCSFMEASVGCNPSFLWRNIWNSKVILHKGARWWIRNGLTTRVKEDVWIPTQLNSLALSPCTNFNEESKVCELIDASRMVWRENLIKREFSKEEAEAICKISLVNQNAEDKLIWKWNADGNYSV
ncbi:hypothetical protein J1N35_021314 [Gossypium stocksii]|uniref:Reverse transcriptase zinc-binding domain-containing protein n=1 Tax=Gossypium stocksii TaxID=47602 RepID=A0A9D3VEH6_9ROSI|nr:hypothetical protein J1N35_021314 [Gossypium stocksii]